GGGGVRDEYGAAFDAHAGIAELFAHFGERAGPMVEMNGEVFHLRRPKASGYSVARRSCAAFVSRNGRRRFAAVVMRRNHSLPRSSEILSMSANGTVHDARFGT